MGRAKFDNTPTGNGDGTITGYDAESGTTATYDPNNPGVRTNVTDANTKRDRYRSLGEAAATAPAYQVDFGLANGDRDRSYYARQDQLNAANMQGLAASGQAPSAAAIMGNQAASGSIGAALGATAGAKQFGTRNAPSMAAAQMQAQQGQAGMQQQAVGQYGNARAGELAGALGSYAGTANTMRQGDYATMGLSQQQADAQAQSENAQRSMNQAGQMGMEQLGVNSEQQQVNSRLRQMQIQANANNTQAAADSARAQMERQQAQGIVSGVGTMLSDDRTKLAAAWDQGHNEALDKVQQYRQMSPQELKALGAKGNRLANAVAGAKGDAWDESRGQNRSMTGPMPVRQPTSFTREDPMTKNLAEGLAPHSYEYKPEFAAAEGQQPGEKNVGPMAQAMASNPVTGQAVSQRPDGLLQIDMKKATKLSLAAAGHNAQKIREQQAQIDALKGGQ